MDAQDIRNLQEAYLGLYQELDEEQVWKEVENWVNSLLEEGYDLSDYTWEEMYESYIEEQGAVNWDTGKTASGVSPRNKAANRQAQFSSSPNPQNLTRAAQINLIRKNMRASIQATGNSSMNKLQSAGPVASLRFKNAAIRLRGGSPPSVPIKTVPGLKSANQAAQARRGGGGSTSRSGNAGTSSGNISPSSASERSGLPRSFRPGAAGSGSFMANSYEPDLYDTILSYLLDEGYANTNEAALAIMTNMSEDWRQSIVEAEVLSKKDGVEGTGVGSNFKARAWTDAEKSRYSSVAAKKPSTPSATPKPAAVQSKPQKQRTTDIITPGFTSQDKDGYIAPTAAAKDNAYHGLYADSSTNKAAAIGDWLGLDRNDPAIKRKMKDWANDDYDRKMAIATNDPKYDPKKISYPEFTPRKRTGREAWDRI